MVRVAGHPPGSRRGRAVLREEMSSLRKVEERHRRLLARLLLAFGLGRGLRRRNAAGVGDRERPSRRRHRRLGDAAFFTAVQPLSVSSSAANPLTYAEKTVDVFLEAWAVFVAK